jgi:BirA family biotin operon repressor/biotin-[acetyl-CoA-carboxylase] ligase
MTSEPRPPDRPPLRVSVLQGLLLAPAGPLARLEVVERTGSTNSDLAAALAADPDLWPDRTVLVADSQEAGRGRAGRTWQVPPRAALTLSLLLRPDARVPVSAFGWLPLLAGLGCVHALRATAGVPARLKWPNDLLVPAPDATALPGWDTDRKVAGILCELVATPTGPAAILGIGVNVSQRQQELPVPFAASLLTAGAGDVDRESLLVALVQAVVEVENRWRQAGGDAVAAGLAEECAGACATLGRQVLVELPGAATVAGTARALGPDGSLIVQDAAGRDTVVLAGDVRHVRASA